MSQVPIVKEIVDELLLNISLVRSPGLYDGRAGIALSLFEASRFLHDPGLEDKAFNLLKESLARTNSDYSFESGLPGIGYAFVHMIINEFIDADFDEVFGSQNESILRHFEFIDRQPDKLLSSLKVLYYFSILSDLHLNDIRYKEIELKILYGVELYLSLQFYDWSNVRYLQNKAKVLCVFSDYLKLVYLSNSKCISLSLIKLYSELFSKNIVASSFTIGYYLHKLSDRIDLSMYSDVIVSNVYYGLQNLHINSLSFDSVIEILNASLDINQLGFSDYLSCAIFADDYMVKMMRKKSASIPLKYGYQNGLARYLIYCSNKNVQLL